MDRDIDAALGERLFEFPDEEPLAADTRQRCGRHLVAARTYRNYLDAQVLLHAQVFDRTHEPRLDQIRLCECEHARTGPDSKRECHHGNFPGDIPADDFGDLTEISGVTILP